LYGNQTKLKAYNQAPKKLHFFLHMNNSWLFL